MRTRRLGMGGGVGEDGGFTLIELLVVIVILALLATVVVFAVTGLSERGTATASKADERMLIKAEQAYMSSLKTAPKYTDESGLVPKFLASVSTMHDICLSPNKKAFKVVPQVAPPGNSCAGVTVPNG